MDGLGGYDWVAWVALGLVLGVIEVTTLDLTFAMLAVGALAGAGAGMVTDSIVVQALVALAVALAMLGVVRPIALRHLRTPLDLRTGTAALVGAQGLVLETVTAQGGRVKVRGEVWSARTYDARASIDAGRNVEIVSIDGATAVVLEPDI